MKFFIENVVFPLHEFLKGHKSICFVRELERSQWYLQDKFYKLQSERLKQLIVHAHMNVPYYKNFFVSEKVSPDSIKSPEDLKKLSFLTKDLIRGNLEIFKSDKANGLIKFNTGGSTGEPLIFYLGKRRISADIAAKLRATRWWGVDIGDPEIVIWGSPVELRKQDIVRNIRDRLFKTRLLSAFDMSEKKWMNMSP